MIRAHDPVWPILHTLRHSVRIEPGTSRVVEIFAVSATREGKMTTLADINCGGAQQGQAAIKELEKTIQERRAAVEVLRACAEAKLNGPKGAPGTARIPSFMSSLHTY